MTDFLSSDDHRDAILKEFSDLFREKYDKGQREHGGRLWKKSTDKFLVEETLDFISYVFTRKDQIESAKKALHIALITDNWDLVKKAYNLLDVGNEEGTKEEDK